MKRRSAATTLRVLTNSYNLKYNYYKIRQMEELPRLFVCSFACLFVPCRSPTGTEKFCHPDGTESSDFGDNGLQLVKLDDTALNQ